MYGDNKRIKYSNIIYITIGIFFGFIQFIRLSNIEFIPNLNPLFSYVFLFISLVVLPILIYVVIYLPSVKIATMNFNLIIKIYIDYTPIDNDVIIENQIYPELKQSSLQVFRCWFFHIELF